jgi:Mn-containing catalase
MTTDNLNTLTQALKMEIEGLCGAERQLAQILPQLARAASSAALRDTFTQHAIQTQQHLQLMQDLVASLDISAPSGVSAGVSGLIADVRQMIDIDGQAVCKDVALIAVAQRIEYYEIAAYSNAQELADFLGLKDISRVLTRVLDEEYAASERLRDVCDQVTREALEQIAA